MKLVALCAQWVTQQPVWAEVSRAAHGITADLVAQALLVPRMARASDNHPPGASHDLSPEQERDVRCLLLTEDLWFASRMRVLNTVLPDGIGEAQRRGINCASPDMARKLLQAMDQFDADSIRLTDIELQVILLTYLSNHANTLASRALARGGS
ncbi:hypothetical protein FOJ82_13475 [Tessaracoccus rhinocerotis]|uniref:Uncharacterized protein n=1 Tax=Tessaracoccus rhinocerotis TaxID=1689449 RepID=A0A553JWQ0_9ACTN|nr:hypothetical protein [Tessaracoccus rhinocerotis]TRY16878.1 hypothetical protein FOJ82_13475 [Tessaracoccus rhinocerotis]